MKKVLITLAGILLLALVVNTQTHTFPAEDTTNVFTGVNTFLGNVFFKNSNNTIYADQFTGATPDAKFTAAIAAASQGQSIEYRCTPGSTLTAFASTVTVSIPVVIRLGGCTFVGPSSGYMFEVTNAGSPTQFHGMGWTTFLQSNANTDLIHFDAGANQSWGQVTDIQVTDNLSAASRTAGAAVYFDQSGSNAEEGVKVDNVIVTQMNLCVYIKFPVNALVSNTSCFSNTGNGITFQGPGSTAYAVNDVVFHIGAADAAGNCPAGGCIGFVFDQVSASGIWGGQSSSKSGTGVKVTGSSLNQSQGFIDFDFDAETDSGLVGTFDGVDIYDVSGWTVMGGDASSQTGSGIHCKGGGGGVIGALNIGNNTRYGVDLSGTSPLGNACAGVTLLSVSWNGSGANLLGNVNDPNLVAIGTTVMQAGNSFAANAWQATHLLQPSTNHDIAGICTLNNASPSVCNTITFAVPYVTAAPICTVSWNGTGTLTGILKAVSTKTTLIVTDSANTETGVINYVCIGNPN